MVARSIRTLPRGLSYGLLVVAGLYFVSALSSLLVQSAGAVGLDFSERSAAFGYLFASPLFVFSLVGAVALAACLEDVTVAGRVALLASGLSSLALAFAVVTFVAGLPAAWGSSLPSSGAPAASRYVDVLLGVAHVLLLGLTTWFALTVARSLRTQTDVPTSAHTQPAEPVAVYSPERPPPGGCAPVASVSPSGWGTQYQGQPAAMWSAGELADSPPDEPGEGTPSSVQTSLDQPARQQPPGAAEETSSGRKWWELPPD